LDGSFASLKEEEEEVPLVRKRNLSTITPFESSPVKKSPPHTAASSTSVSSTIASATTVVNTTATALMSAASAAVAATGLHLHHRTGVSCIVCDAKKSPSAVHIPFVYLGRFSEFMICRKSHFTEEEDYKLLTARLTAAWELIKTNGTDEPNTSFIDSQDEESPAFSSAHKCVGYRQMDGEAICGASCGIELFFDLNEPTRHYFCKPSHLLRYFMLHFGKQGKNFHENRHRADNDVKKKDKKKGKKKSDPTSAADTNSTPSSSSNSNSTTSSTGVNH
jgi:hypothetical protein